jgi:hypothetical protein
MCLYLCCVGQISSERLMQHLSDKKANADVRRASASGSGGGAGTSSTARRRSRKRSSAQDIQAAGTDTGASTGQPLVAATTNTAAGAAAVAHGPVQSASPDVPWFKRLSIETLALTIDYNVRCPNAWHDCYSARSVFCARSQLPGLANCAAWCVVSLFARLCTLQLLETCFLVSAVLVLMAGMVFSADGFTRSSTGYYMLTVFVSGTIVVVTATFAVLLVFEAYRSVKYAEAHALARQVEEEAMEEAVLGRWRRRTVAQGGGARRRSSLASTLQHNSSFGRRPSAGLRRPSTAHDADTGASEGQTSDSEAPLRRCGSNLSESVAFRRRKSLLDRLQGVLDAADSGGGLAQSGHDVSDSNSASMGADEAPFSAQAPGPSELPPPPPPSAHQAISMAQARAGDVPAAPPPPPPREFGDSHVRGIDTVVAAAAAARGLRVRTLAARERGSAASRMVRVEPASDSAQAGNTDPKVPPS